MKALRKLAAEHQHLELVDVEPPSPPRPGWVVLDVTYAGICGTDQHITHNSFPSWPPVTLGHEFTGRVAAVGREVADVVLGDRVVCEPHSLACGVCHLCRRGHHELCAAKRSPGWGIDGAMAEQVAVPAHLLHRVPDSVDDVAAALCEPLAVAVTAFQRSPVEPGSSVLVTGPGPVGILAALTARACGAGTVVLAGRASSRERLDLAAGLGVTVWDTGATDLDSAASELTGGRGFDHVVECSGAPAAVAQCIGAARRRGRMTVLGVPDGATAEVPWGLAMNRALDISFSLSSAWASWDAALALMARGAVDPRPLASIFPLQAWPEAFDALAARTVVKALLDPSPTSSGRTFP